MYIAVEAATVIVEMLMVSIYLKGLYQTYVKKSMFVCLSYIISGIGVCLLSIFLVNPMIKLLYGFLIFFLMSKILFNAKWLPAFYSALLLCVINIIVDVVSQSIIVFFGIPTDSLFVYGNNRILFIVFGKLVTFFFILLVIKLSNSKRSHGSLVEAIPLFLCQVFSIYICYFMYRGSLDSAAEITLSFIIGSVGVLYINIVVFLYVERIKEVSEIKKQNELAELQYQSKVEYFDQVKDDQNETRALWHDIKKYLNTMNELMNNNEIAHARACIEQVADLFADIGNVVDVGNTVISAVLNHSIQKARRFNIETELDIRVQPDLHVSAADMSVIIGNTFDNAIEACSSLNGDKKIVAQLIQKGGILFYEISNPYDKDTPHEKENPKLHGFGLKNVQRCIDKYKGTMNIDATDTLFIVSVHMNIPFESDNAQRVS